MAPPILLALVALLLTAATAGAAIRGVVLDAEGRPVANARVEAGTGEPRFTGIEGEFALAGDPPLLLRITASGFLPAETLVTSEPATITLESVRVSEELTVTASRAGVRIDDTPASTVVVTREELEASAAPTIDDALRSVPGFALFRRSGSRTANPTAQGVSLRGVGASGASRTAVLDDGVPLNDAFGGWIYWGRVPITAIDRIEIVRGGSSDLFGGSASSGAIQLVRASESSGFVADLSAGNASTSRLSLSGAVPAGPFTLRLDGERFQTSGYVPVRPDQRGTVDVAAGVERSVIDLTLSHSARAGIRSFARLGVFEEERDNGTVLQENATDLLSFAAGLDLPMRRGAYASLRGFATDQDYEQTFSAISPDRSTERLIRRQQIPSRSLGLSAHLAHPHGTATTIVAGADLRHVRGSSDERIFFGDESSEVSSGGEQRTASLFLELMSSISGNLTLFGSLRHDQWRNEESSGAGGRRTARAWSPRVAALYRLTDGWALTGSAYESFRAPTLNELYRPFRVGNVLTEANALLDAETVRGFELGARRETAATSIRANAFTMTTEDSVANVTLSITPELITRQRRNLGRSRSQGIELDAEWRPRPSLRIAGGWLFTNATVVSFAAEPEIVGRRLPQVPRHHASLRASWDAPRATLLGAELRWIGSAFDDDRNELPLASFATLDLFASKRLTRNWSGYLALENALDEEIEVAKTPVTSLGQPRAWRAGARYRR